ncbi:hypothetical protein ACJX0J_006260, partial [Zea mays]
CNKAPYPFNLPLLVWRLLLSTINAILSSHHYPTFMHTSPFRRFQETLKNNLALPFQGLMDILSDIIFSLYL